MNTARSLTIPSPPVSRATVAVNGNDASSRSSRDKEATKIESNRQLEEEEESCRKRSFMILKPQSVQSTFTRMPGSGFEDQPQTLPQTSNTEPDLKHTVPDAASHSANIAGDPDSNAASHHTEPMREDRDPFAGIAADVTDSSGRRVLMTPQQLESRLGAEPAFRRGGGGGAATVVPPLSFATLAAFAPTPASGADASPGGGGELDSSSASERDLLRDLRQVPLDARRIARVSGEESTHAHARTHKCSRFVNSQSVRAASCGATSRLTVRLSLCLLF